MELFDKVPYLTGYEIASSGFPSRSDAYDYKNQYIPGPDATVWFCQEDRQWYVILQR